MNVHDPGASDALARWSARLGVALIGLAFAGLATLWAWDRTRTRETPRFEPARFAALAGTPTPDSAGRWLAVVNPTCARCRSEYPRIVERRATAPGLPALEVLLVDLSGRPTRALLALFPADRAWWDSAGVWRRAWGHRVYGEVLRFDPHGTLLGVDPPSVAR